MLVGFVRVFGLLLNFVFAVDPFDCWVEVDFFGFVVFVVERALSFVSEKVEELVMDRETESGLNEERG